MTDSCWGSGVEADLSESAGVESRALALWDGAVTGLVTRARAPKDSVDCDLGVFDARRGIM